MAIVEFPFPYEAEIIRHRCRRPERITVIGKAAARVRELSAAEAPIAAVLETRRERWSPGHGEIRGRDIRIAYRQHEGGMLRPYARGMADPDEVPTRPLPDLDALQADLDAWAARPPEEMHTWTLLPGRRILLWRPMREREAELAARRWVGDDRARRAASLVRAMESGAALVDGVLHLPSGGPAWALRVTGRYAEGQGGAQTYETFAEIHAYAEFGWVRANPERREAILRGDRLEHARRMARRLIAETQAAHRPHPRDMIPQVFLAEPVISGRIDVRLPDAFRVDDASAALAREAGRTIAEVKDLIWMLDPAGLRACAEVKEAIGAVEAGAEGADERLLRASADLERRLGAAFPGRLPWREGDSPLARWRRLRPPAAADGREREARAEDAPLLPRP